MCGAEFEDAACQVMCVYIYMYHMYFMYTWMHMYTHAYTLYIHIYLRVCKCIYIHTCAYTHTHTCTQTYVYIYTRTHIHTHTHIHRYLNEKSVAGVVQLDGDESEWDRLYFFPPGAFANMCITQKVVCRYGYRHGYRQHVHYPEGRA